MKNNQFVIVKFYIFFVNYLGEFPVVHIYYETIQPIYSPKIPPKFICEKCDYSCYKKGDFNKHLRSIKHLNTTNTTQIPTTNSSMRLW